MRKELKNIINDNSNIDAKELNESFRLIKKIIDLRIEDLNKEWKETEKENPDLVDDIMDDIVWYSAIENEIIIQSGIWRLHSLFEKIILQELFKRGLEPWGFKEVLKLIKKEFQIDDSTIEELRLWGDLRHKISHKPISRITNTTLNLDDLKDQLNLYLKCLKLITP